MSIRFWRESTRLRSVRKNSRFGSHISPFPPSTHVPFPGIFLYSANMHSSSISLWPALENKSKRFPSAVPPRPILTFVQVGVHAPACMLACALAHTHTDRYLRAHAMLTSHPPRIATKMSITNVQLPRLAACPAGNDRRSAGWPQWGDPKSWKRARRSQPYRVRKIV